MKPLKQPYTPAGLDGYVGVHTARAACDAADRAPPWRHHELDMSTRADINDADTVGAGHHKGASGYEIHHVAVPQRQRPWFHVVHRPGQRKAVPLDKKITAQRVHVEPGHLAIQGAHHQQSVGHTDGEREADDSRYRWSTRHVGDGVAIERDVAYFLHHKSPFTHCLCFKKKSIHFVF